VAPIFGAAPLYIKKDKKWQMPLIMRPALGCLLKPINFKIRLMQGNIFDNPNHEFEKLIIWFVKGIIEWLPIGWCLLMGHLCKY
jgi:hypothetical protein